SQPTPARRWRPRWPRSWGGRSAGPGGGARPRRAGTSTWSRPSGRGPRWIRSRRRAWPSPRRDELRRCPQAPDVPAGPGATAAVAGPPGPRRPDDVRGRDERAATVRAGSVAPGGKPPRPELPERVAARLRELRSSGRSELLSGTLAALNEAGWPLRSLGEALGISRQAVQARVRRRATAGLRDPGVPCEPPPPFPQRRVASPAGLRPHLTIKIDHTLRVSAHQAA